MNPSKLRPSVSGIANPEHWNIHSRAPYEIEPEASRFARHTRPNTSCWMKLAAVPYYSPQAIKRPAFFRTHYYVVFIVRCLPPNRFENLPRDIVMLFNRACEQKALLTRLIPHFSLSGRQFVAFVKTKVFRKKNSPIARASIEPTFQASSAAPTTWLSSIYAR